MESEQTHEENNGTKKPSSWNTVTPLSKYLAMVLFVALPFIGGWIGYSYSPQKIDRQNKTVEIKNTEDKSLNQDEQETSKSPPEQANLANSHRESVLTSQIKTNFDEEQWKNASDRVKKVLQEISYDWLDEISFQTFYLQGVSGEVIHYCDTGNTVFDRNRSPLCLGGNIIVIAWNGNVEVIAEEDTPTQDSLFRLHAIFFNEGKFEKITESTAEEAALLIVVDELACIDVYADMCFSDFSLSYVVNMPNLQVNQINEISPIGYDTGRPVSGSGSLISQWPSAESFYWNGSGTKAIYDTPCPAGCSDSIYEGFDLNVQTIVPLLSRVDGYYNGQFGGGPDKEDLEWLSENEVRVGTSTLSF